MQRLVHGTRFTYAKTELNEKNELVATLATVEVAETDPKRALRKAFGLVGHFNPLKVDKFETLYFLDDAIFFKYAKPKFDPTDITEDTPTDTTEDTPTDTTEDTPTDTTEDTPTDTPTED